MLFGSELMCVVWPWKQRNLPLIPPLNGRLGIRYTNSGLGSAEFSVFGAGRQDKIAEGEQETPGYYRLDVALNTKTMYLGPVGIQLFAGIDNITNNRYTNHLSTNRGDISVEPGRIIPEVKLSLIFHRADYDLTVNRGRKHRWKPKVFFWSGLRTLCILQ